MDGFRRGPPHVISAVWSSWPEFHARQIRRRGCAVRVPPFLHAGEAGGGTRLAETRTGAPLEIFFFNFFLEQVRDGGAVGVGF